LFFYHLSKNPYQIHQIQQNQKLANVKATGQTDKKPHKATIKRKTKQKNPIPQKTNKKKKFIFNKKAKTLRGLS